MADLLYVILDGAEYALPIEYPSIERSFSFVDGGQGGVMQSGLEVLDTIGTRYSYSLRIPATHKNPTVYDSFYQAISNPDRIHSVTLPYGQSTMTFNCKIEGGTDTLHSNVWTHKAWGDLTVKFTPIIPQRFA